MTRYVPVKAQGLNDAVAIAVGRESACALHSDGGVSCWVANNAGELGDGGDLPHFYFPRRVAGVSDVVAISVGFSSTCAIHSNGRVTCWGWPCQGPPQQVEGLRGVTAISVGRAYTCAVVAGGRGGVLVHLRQTDHPEEDLRPARRR